MGIGYLQRLERGKVQQPTRETLERILAVLEASTFTERREVLALFGYALAPMMPTDTEVHQAIQAFHTQMAQATLPAYLLDYSHHLLAWNPLVPKLFKSLTPSALMPRLIFDSVNGIAASVLNPDSFFSAQIRILNYEYQRYGNEAWHSSFVSDMRHYQVFNDYWYQPKFAQSTSIAMRPATDLKLALGQGRGVA